MSNFLTSWRHLIRRFLTSLSQRMPTTDDIAWVKEMLLVNEFKLWNRMKPFDQRHSIEVARRFTDSYPLFTRDQAAAALLHDVGKIESDLGVLRRVVATIVGPVGTKFRSYHDHESIGCNLCHVAGSTSETLRLLNWTEESSRNDLVVVFLRQADEI
jgi:hypothetical protein